MDVNNINTNVSSLNTSSSLGLEKTSSSKSINKINGSGADLYINEYNKKRDELSLSVQSLNDGIAISNIAQNAIEKQQELLKNVQTKLENTDSYQDKNELKQSINSDLRAFNQVAYETKYKKESLLVNDYNSESTTIDINAKNETFSIEKPNTPAYANEIFELSNNSDLNNQDSLNTVKNKVQSSSNELQNDYNNFSSFGNRLQSSAKETIKEQVDLYNQNKINKDRNFGQDSTDFSKSNVTTNVGYLAASQANIVQAQSVKLLS